LPSIKHTTNLEVKFRQQWGFELPATVCSLLSILSRSARPLIVLIQCTQNVYV
jgi:hypothetical protein